MPVRSVTAPRQRVSKADERLEGMMERFDKTFDRMLVGSIGPSMIFGWTAARHAAGLGNQPV